MNFLLATIAVIGFLSAGICQESDESELRTWFSSTGKFSIAAKMTLSADDKFNADVLLVKEDGESVTVPYDRLNRESQLFAEAQRKAVRRRVKESLDAEKKGKLPMVDSDKAEPAASETQDDPAAAATRVWNWRGPNQDGIADESDLNNDWRNHPPDLLWSVDGLGSAMSSLAIADGRIYTMGNLDGSEFLFALQLSDGREIWKTRVGAGGESNSTPTVDGDLVFAVGRNGDLICANASDGEKVWSKSFTADFGGKMMSQWGYSESPLVDGEQVICTPGGPEAMMVALNKKTGKVIWATPMLPGGSRGTDGAGYSSPVISNGGGVKQYITLVGRGLISVEAKTGTPLWQYEKIANGTANVPTPIVDGDFVFCSSGYDDGGTALLRITGRRGQMSVQEMYYLSAKELQNHHGGMVKIGQYVYMGEGHNQGFPCCVEMKTGRVLWPKQRGAGTGSAAIVAADGHLYFRYEDATMALIEANPQEYRLKGSFKIASRNGQSWPHPVIYGGKLFLRDQQQLHCYDLKK